MLNWLFSALPKVEERREHRGQQSRSQVLDDFLEEAYAESVSVLYSANAYDVKVDDAAFFQRMRDLEAEPDESSELSDGSETLENDT